MKTLVKTLDYFTTKDYRTFYFDERNDDKFSISQDEIVLSIGTKEEMKTAFLEMKNRHLIK